MKKSIIISLCFLAMSCKKNGEVANPSLDETVSYNEMDSTAMAMSDTLQLSDEVTKELETLTSPKYSFVIFETTEGYNPVKYIRSTEVFETSYNMSEDEKYKILDKSQSGLPKYGNVSVDNRYIKTFDSYAEASKERERLLSIGSESSVNHSNGRTLGASKATESAADNARDAAADAKSAVKEATK